MRTSGSLIWHDLTSLLFNFTNFCLKGICLYVNSKDYIRSLFHKVLFIHECLMFCAALDLFFLIDSQFHSILATVSVNNGNL